jgi:hypothetical protein
MGKLESIVVTSTIGIERRQFWRRTSDGLGKSAFNGRLKLRSVFIRELFDLRENLFHLVPAEGAHGMAFDVTK